MIQLYDDYIELKNKQPLGTVDDVPHYTDPPEHLSDYGGRLIDGLVLVDIDDEDQANILFNIINDLNINTIVRETPRGYHFYFKESGYTHNVTPVKCAIGLKIEIKKYRKKSFEPIKENKKMRKIVKDGDFLDDVPLFLTPMPFAPEWLGLGKGDGRNSKLFEFQIMLAKKGIEYEDGKKIGQIINDYILPEPLPQREFNEVWREEAYPSVIPNFYKDNGGFLHNIFADYMIEKYHVVNINGKLHVYNNGVYESEFETRSIQLKMIDEIPNITDRQRREVLSYMELKAITTALADPQYILVKNGIYDLNTSQLSPFDYTKVFINKINYDYVSGHDDEVLSSEQNLVETTLDKMSCGDEDVYFLLKEIIGYCLYRKNTFRVCPILVGDGSNGKSSYIKMIQHLLGESNYSSLSLSDIQTTFRPAEIAGKLVNLGDDINNDYIKDTSDIKKLITGETIIVEHKNKRAFQLKSYAKMIFTTNDLSNVSDKSMGWMSRIQTIPFNAVFSKDDDDYDRNIDTKLEADKCMEYLLSISIDAIQDVLNRDAFTVSKVVEEMKKEYGKQNNTLLQFFDEVDDLDDYIVGKKRGELLLSYKSFCIENGIDHSLSSVKLGKYINKLGYATNGNSRLYVKKVK